MGGTNWCLKHRGEKNLLRNLPRAKKNTRGWRPGKIIIKKEFVFVVLYLSWVLWKKYLPYFLSKYMRNIFLFDIFGFSNANIALVRKAVNAWNSLTNKTWDGANIVHRYFHVLHWAENMYICYCKILQNGRRVCEFNLILTRVFFFLQ